MQEVLLQDAIEADLHDRFDGGGAPRADAVASLVPSSVEAQPACSAEGERDHASSEEQKVSPSQPNAIAKGQATKST